MWKTWIPDWPARKKVSVSLSFWHPREIHKIKKLSAGASNVYFLQLLPVFRKTFTVKFLELGVNISGADLSLPELTLQHSRVSSFTSCTNGSLFFALNFFWQQFIWTGQWAAKKRAFDVAKKPWSIKKGGKTSAQNKALFIPKHGRKRRHNWQSVNLTSEKHNHWNCFCTQTQWHPNNSNNFGHIKLCRFSDSSAIHTFSTCSVKLNFHLCFSQIYPQQTGFACFTLHFTSTEEMLKLSVVNVKAKNVCGSMF